MWLGATKPTCFTASGGNSRGLPRSVSLGAQEAERGSGDQVRLEIEGVVDGGVAGKEALG